MTSDTDTMPYSFILMSFALESKMHNFLLHSLYEQNLTVGIIPLSQNNLVT